MAHVVNLNAYALESAQPGFFAGIRDAIANNREYVRIRKELDALSDRDLADVNLSRLNIRDVAREAVYGR